MKYPGTHTHTHTESEFCNSAFGSCQMSLAQPQERNKDVINTKLFL